MYKIIFLALAVFLTGCTTLQVVETNSETGYFPGSKRANIVKEVAVDLDSHKGLILVPNGDFTKNMIVNINYFDDVINFEDLESIIITNNLTDQVPSINDKIGINKAAKAYKPFMQLRWKNRRDGNRTYKQLLLINPLTLEEIFVCETLMDHVWAGVNDQNNWYPMMNSLIDYIKSNSTVH